MLLLLSKKKKKKTILYEPSCEEEGERDKPRDRVTKGQESGGEG
jgi:hypothetical protein